MTTFNVNGAKRPPYFVVQPDGTLQLTVDPDAICVCQECPHLHIRVFANATSANLRHFADAICQLADQLEPK